MNQGRIWTVVSPQVGLPLLLGSVTLIAVVVHLALISHATWYPVYWSGKAPKTSMIEAPATPAALTYTIG